MTKEFPEAVKTKNMIRKWIKQAEDNGCLTGDSILSYIALNSTKQGINFVPVMVINEVESHLRRTYEY